MSRFSDPFSSHHGQSDSPAPGRRGSQTLDTLKVNTYSEEGFSVPVTHSPTRNIGFDRVHSNFGPSETSSAQQFIMSRIHLGIKTLPDLSASQISPKTPVAMVPSHLVLPEAINSNVSETRQWMLLVSANLTPSIVTQVSQAIHLGARAISWEENPTIRRQFLSQLIEIQKPHLTGWALKNELATVCDRLGCSDLGDQLLPYRVELRDRVDNACSNLWSTDLNTQRGAAATLRDLAPRDIRVVNNLVELVKLPGTDDWVRDDCIQALGHIGLNHSVVIPALLNTLQAGELEEPTVRNILSALSNFGGYAEPALAPLNDLRARINPSDPLYEPLLLASYWIQLETTNEKSFSRMIESSGRHSITVAREIEKMKNFREFLQVWGTHLEPIRTVSETLSFQA